MRYAFPKLKMLAAADGANVLKLDRSFLFGLAGVECFCFSRASDERSYQKLEKVGPFECDELEKHCRVSAKCYPTKLPALCTMAKENSTKINLKNRMRDVTKM